MQTKLWRRFTILWGCGLLLTSLSYAQTSNPNAVSELNITLGEQRVRFAPTRSFEEMRLEVMNRVGEVVFTHLTAEAEFDWPLRAGNGDALAPGLYAYVLTLKFGGDQTRQHRGHLIIEQGQQQVWLTAQDGAEVSSASLQAARTGGRSVAGLAASEDKSANRDIAGREVVDQKGNKLTDNKKSAKQEKANLLTTPNRMAKFAGDGVTTIDSVVTDTGHLSIDSSSNLQPAGTGTLIIEGSVNKERVELRSAGGTPGPALQGKGFGGTIAAPTATLLNTDLFIIGGSGYNGSSLVSFNAGTVKIRAEQNWTAGANGAYINFETTPAGSTTAARAERMRITGAGNVGINTVAPSARLEVVKSSAAEDATMIATAYGDDNAVIGRAANGTVVVPTATPVDRSLLFLGGRGYTGAGFTFSRVGINLAASETWTNTNNGTRISFDTTANGSATRVERMRINHNGNVGIGTTSPDAPLEVISDSVNGALYTTTFGADNVVIGRSAGGTAVAPTATPTGRSLLLLGGRGHNGTGFTLTRAAMNMEASENWTNTATGTRIMFNTTTNGTLVSSERMRIDHDGRVGIGTNAPASTLDVNGIVGAVTQYNLGGSRMLSTPGTSNLFVGLNAGNVGLTGFSNATFGEEAGQSIADGDRNSFFGRSAGQFTSGGNHNSFFGHTAGRGNDLGDENTFFGYQAGLNNDFGNNNAFFGTETGLTNTTGDNNTLLGHSANVNSNNLNFATAIGAGAVVSNSNQIQLGRGTDTVRVGSFAAAADNHVCYDILNTLSSCSSSRRYKENIQPLRSGLKLIQQMRPVTFDWIGRRAPSLGLIAEEVAAVEPRLVTHNLTGAIEGVKYDQITAVLIKAVKEQQAQIVSLKKLVCRSQPKAAACQPVRQKRPIAK